MTNDPLAALPTGRKVTVSKTVSESDVCLFAGITGDLSPYHTDEDPRGHRGHVGSRTATIVFSRVTVTTDRGRVVAAATHILKRVDV